MIDSVAELYVHAIAIEREAAERYAELAQRMDDLGNDAVAGLFGFLARAEALHLAALRRRTEGVALPALDTDHSWLGGAPPECVARELVFRLMSQRDALQIALQAEKRARAFFEQVVRSAGDPALRALAREMAAEEAEHVALIERMLDRTPDPNIDWSAVLGGP